MRSAVTSLGRASSLLAAFLAAAVVAGILAAGVALPVAWGVGASTKGGVQLFNSLPGNLENVQLSQRSTMYANDGKTVIATFYSENRSLVPLSAVSPVMRQAIVAIEDSRFYQHGGVDARGILRAFAANLAAGHTVQGASTLTQQYVKNVFVERAVAAGDEQAYYDAIAQNTGRKVQEMKYAIELEQKLTKDQILERYLNIAPFGDSTYGIEAAAMHYFGVHAKDLDLAQSATLAGLVKAPTAYDPRTSPDAAQTRRDVVLQRMLDLHIITKAEYDKAKAVSVKKTLHITRTLNGCANTTPADYAWFCTYVVNQMMKNPDFAPAMGKTAKDRENTLYRGGLRIVTTLWPKVQKVATATAMRRFPVDNKQHIATGAVTVENNTGRILAMAQNRNYSVQGGPGQTSINYTVDEKWGGSSGFQTGSTFKPFTLATWLSQGKSLASVVDASQHTFSYPNFTRCGKTMRGPSFRVSNSEGNESYPMSVLTATEDSVNTAYMQMMSQLDLCQVGKTAQAIGAHRAAPKKGDCAASASLALDDCYPNFTLGTNEMSMLTMASAYSTFANNGVHCTPIAVQQMISNSKELPIPKSTCTRAISPEVAQGVNYALQKVITSGTGRGLSPGHVAAGKTGTTDASRNVWFVGYTPKYSTAVWTADPNRYPKLGNEQKPMKGISVAGTYYANMYGSTGSGPTWQAIMKTASASEKNDSFGQPPSKMLYGSRVNVPSVVGRSLSSATSTLSALGFKVSVASSRQDSRYPYGYVAGQSTSGRALVGSQITLTLSTGQMPPAPSPSSTSSPSSSSSSPSSSPSPSATKTKGAGGNAGQGKKKPNPKPTTAPTPKR